MPSPNLSELITTTLRDRTGVLADNVTNHIPLLKRLKEKGNVRIRGGGRTLVKELDYQENSTFKWYDGYEPLDISGSDVLTSAEFDWKQAAVNVVISGKEARMNDGEEQSIDLLEGRITNAERTLMNNIATGCASDGTGSGSKQIGGLQALVADDPTTGTVGGINRATYSFWRNNVYDATSDGGAATSATNVLKYMDNMWLEVVRNADHPDLIVGGSNMFSFFWQALQSIQRINGESKAVSGFRTLSYFGPGGAADVIYDSTIATTRMYFLNTNFVFFEVHRKANFVPLAPRESINQDATVRPIIFMGNMTLSNAARQGIFKE